MSTLSTNPPMPLEASPVDAHPEVQHYARLASGEPMRRLTREEYYKMAEFGLLSAKDRVELLDGVIVEMSPIGYLHQMIVDELVEFFTDRRAGRYRVRGQGPQATSSVSDPEPDVQLLRLREDRYGSGHPEPGSVYLVIEVADSSLGKDLGLKKQIYAAAGIVEYWVVDIPNRKVIVHTRPDQQAASYKSVITHDDNEKVAPAGFTDCEVDLAWLFGPKQPGQGES